MSKENKLLLAAFFLGLLFFMYLGTRFAFRSRAEAININLKLKLQGNFQAGSRLKIRIDVYDSNSAKVAQFENIPLLYTDSGFFEGMVILEQNLDTSVPYALFIKPQNYLGHLVCSQEKFGSDCQYPEIYLDNSGKLYDLTSTLFYAGDLAPQNGKVDSADFSQIIANYGTNNEIGDINSDGIVNGVDFALAITTLSLNKTDDNYEQCVDRFFKEVCSIEDIDILFRESCNEIRNSMKNIKNKKLTISFSLHLLIKQIYSILIDSDRYDTFLFMENRKEKSSIDSKRLWELYSKRLEDKINDFKSMHIKTFMEQKIIDLRMKIADLCYDFSKNDRDIYTLTVPTGGGKTLSSLRFALNHAKVKGMERIIYILPYTTIIEQNAAVVRDVLQCDENILEHHCNVIHTEDEKYKLLTQRWDCLIVFTTMVQFLNTFYEAGTSSMRRLHQINNLTHFSCVSSKKVLENMLRFI